MSTANAKTLKPSYLVSEILATVGTPQVYGEKLIKPSMLACASEVLGKDAASALNKISLSDDTITRRQDEIASFVEDEMVKILRKTKFFSRLMRARFIAKLSFLSMSDSS